MAYTIEQPSPCRVELTGTIPRDEVQDARARIVAAVARRAVVPGFRRGKAPTALVERRFAEDIRQELEEQLLRRLWQEVQENEKLRPATPLGVRGVSWNEDGSLHFTGEFEVYPQVELPTLESFVPPEFDITPSGEEVERALASLQERMATWEPVEAGVAENGMLVEAEIWGSFPDGERPPFHDEQSRFVLGAGEVVAEIEAAVLGHAVGEEVLADREVRMSEGDKGEEQQRTVRLSYRIAIKSLRRKRLPELDDNFAASFGFQDGLAALRERVIADLRQQKRNARYERWREALLAHLGQGRVLDLPATLLEEGAQKELVKFVQSLAQEGIDPEKAALDWNRVREELRERVANRLRAELLLDALADAQGLTVSEAEVEQELQQQARRMGVPFAELRGNLSKSGGLERLKAALRREKAVGEVLSRFLAQAGE